MQSVLIGAMAVACACMGGVFFAFSTLVMPALVALPAPAGVRAMQSINIFAITTCSPLTPLSSLPSSST